MKPGKHQRSKQRYENLFWKVHDSAECIVLHSYTIYELRNQNVSIVDIFPTVRRISCAGASGFSAPRKTRATKTNTIQTRKFSQDIRGNQIWLFSICLVTKYTMSQPLSWATQLQLKALCRLYDKTSVNIVRVSAAQGHGGLGPVKNADYVVDRIDY